MAHKKPLKEDYQLKERFKIESEVFDKRSLLDLSKLINKGILRTVDYPVSTGKEANVFRATTPDGAFVAVKMYKTETAPFFRKEEYLEADPRFSRIKHSEREIVKAFARKEFKNLEICQKAGVNAPRPIYLLGRIVIMSFLGEGELPYPNMSRVGPLHGEADLESILGDVKKMYMAGLVHADLSEYNILMGAYPYLIDFGQGVITRHPNAEKFLERDIAIILKYFGKRGFVRDFAKTMEWIRSK